jgi:hypothetical protein
MSQKLQILSAAASQFAEYGLAANGPSSSLGAGSLAQIPSALEITMAEFRDIVEGRQFLILAGIADYHDVFGAKHEVRWDFEYRPETAHFAGGRFSSTT